MTRRCSHCSHNGHNSRTCPNRGVKIFGVRLTDGSAIRKSASMGNLSLLSAGSTSGGASPADGPDLADGGGGYASDDFVQGSSSASRERKKGERIRRPISTLPLPSKSLIDHPSHSKLMRPCGTPDTRSFQSQIAPSFPIHLPGVLLLFFYVFMLSD